MKITKTASGKQEVRISKSDWQNIGKKAGWIPTKKAAVPYAEPTDMKVPCPECGAMANVFKGKEGWKTFAQYKCPECGWIDMKWGGDNTFEPDLDLTNPFKSIPNRAPVINPEE